MLNAWDPAFGSLIPDCLGTRQRREGASVVNGYTEHVIIRRGGGESRMGQ